LVDMKRIVNYHYNKKTEESDLDREPEPEIINDTKTQCTIQSLIGFGLWLG